MEQKYSLAMTPQEVRELLVARVERSLRESGVTLTQDTREQIAALLPLPNGHVPQGGDGQPATDGAAGHYRPTIREARAVLATVDPAAGSRAKIYKPTDKAKPVQKPLNDRDRVLNLIVRSEVCTITDLEKGTRRPRRALYTALWGLKKDGLIDSASVAALKPTAEDHN